MSPFNLLRSVLRPGMTALDVGANAGRLTQCMAEAVGPTGRVYAIEPCAKTVQANGGAQWLTGLRVAPVLWLTMALGREDGWATLYHSDEDTRHTLYRPNVLAGDGTEERVRVRSLNSLQAEGELPRRVEVVKLDTQGAEDDILAGGSALLAAGQTAWVVEIWPAGLYGAGSSVKRLTERFEGLHLQPLDQSWDEVRRTAADYQGHGSFDLVVHPS